MKNRDGNQKLIRRAALLGLLFTLGLIAINAVVAHRITRQLFDDAGWVDHTHAGLHQLHAIESDLFAAEAGVRGRLVAGDDVFLQSYPAAVARVAGRADAVAELTKDNGEQRTRIPASAGRCRPN